MVYTGRSPSFLKEHWVLVLLGFVLPIIFIIFISTIAYLAGKRSDEFELNLRMGDDLLKNYLQGDTHTLPKAADFYLTAQKLANTTLWGPNDGQKNSLYIRLGLIQLLNNDPGRAQIDFEQAARIKPCATYPHNLIKYGEEYFVRTHASTVADLISDAISQDKGFPEIHKLVECYLRGGNQVLKAQANDELIAYRLKVLRTVLMRSGNLIRDEDCRDELVRGLINLRGRWLFQVAQLQDVPPMIAPVSLQTSTDTGSQVFLHESPEVSDFNTSYTGITVRRVDRGKTFTREFLLGSIDTNPNPHRHNSYTAGCLILDNPTDRHVLIVLQSGAWLECSLLDPRTYDCLDSVAADETEHTMRIAVFDWKENDHLVDSQNALLEYFMFDSRPSVPQNSLIYCVGGKNEYRIHARQYR